MKKKRGKFGFKVGTAVFFLISAIVVIVCTIISPEEGAGAAVEIMTEGVTDGLFEKFKRKKKAKENR